MIKKWVMQRKTIRLAYRAKFYLDIAISQISWVTAKFPEAMAIIFLVEKFSNYSFTWQAVIMFSVTGAVALTLIGKGWHATGLYHTEKFTQADKDPVMNELLRAARKINGDKQ